MDAVDILHFKEAPRDFHLLFRCWLVSEVEMQVEELGHIMSRMREDFVHGGKISR